VTGAAVEEGPYPDMVATEWDDVSYVISSRYRIATLRRLSDGPATPSRIADETDLSVAHVSRALQELRDHTLVELLVSEDRKKGRVYGITDRGNQVWQTIETENMT
jgi:DNA-binding MarR family transcriptional regulator